MKQHGILAALIVLGAGSFWLTRPRDPGGNDFPAPNQASGRATTVTGGPTIPSQGPETPPPAPDLEPEPELPPPVTPPPRAISIAAVEELPAGPETSGPNSGLPPATLLENMRGVVRQYYLRFHENPVGNNLEITEALSGANSKQVVFLQPDDGMRVNTSGELVDNWGTPFFFHSLSRSEMEIRSAGPDQKLWTADDLVMK